MKTEKKISLIICAYNEEKYLGECLDSAIKYAGDKLYEILVIDNASTDKTKEIAEKRPGVRVVREDAKGLTRARQRGYHEAKGDILAYVDADTHIPAGWIEKIIEAFNTDEDLACISGPYIYHDIPKRQQFMVKMYWYSLAMPIYWFIGYMVVGGNFAISRKTLDKMNGFDTTIEFYGEDTNIARRAHSFGKVLFKPSFVMYTSGRRLSKQGIVSTSFAYSKNFLSEALLHKPVTQTYKDHR